MNVTEVPAQTGFAEAAIVTLTVRIGLTVIVTVFDVAGFPDGQVALEVSKQVIASAFAGIYEYAELVAPAMSVPPFFH